MKIAVYGSKGAAEEIRRLLCQSSDYCFQKLLMSQWDRYDVFLQEYPTSGAAALLVTAEGGEGLEAMTAAMTLLPDTPRAWFSADKGLCPQAMRLGAAYFGEKPVTQNALKHALQRCKIPENYIRVD